jgi:iron complex outermembrane receptor protein
MSSQSKRPLLLCSAAPAIVAVAAALICAAPGSAFAQAKPSEGSDKSVNSEATEMSEVVVTARKQSETLLEVPLAITAMSSATIEKKAITSLAEVADFTPSLNVVSFSASNTNRSFQTVIIRGMVPGSTTNYTSTVFINGVPIAASGIVDGISDVAQIEVIKGPQSAYFGRSTFGGAINIITKAPKQGFRVTLDGLYGSNHWKDLKGTVEGAIIPGILAARLTGRTYSTDGYYSTPSYPGFEYGAQSSKNLLGEISFTPNDRLTVRAFGAHTTTDDGYQSFVRYTAADFNCTLSAAATGRIYCGELPIRYPNSPNADPLPPAFLNGIKNTPSRLATKGLGLDHAGSRSRVRLATLNINYELGDSGYTFTSLSGANDFISQNISSGSNPGTPIERREAADGRALNVAYNQEFRIASDPSKRLRGLVGVNYSYLMRGGQGAGSVSAPLFVFATNENPVGFNVNKTRAIFAAATYDITDQLILNLEGRYQVPTTVGKNRVLVNGKIVNVKIPGLYDRVHEFLPRAILQYKFAPGHQVFATYAKGSNPGIFNTANVNFTPQLQEYLETLFGGGLAVKSEHITSYELGYKGELFDSRLQLDVGVYYAEWRDQTIVQGLRILNPPLTGIPGTLATNMFSNQGATDLQGVEANFFFRATDSLSVSGGGSINDTKIIFYTNTNSSGFLGYTPGTAPLDLFEGNQLPYSSKYSANVAVDYSHAITDSVEGFVHVDALYKSRTFAEPGNFYWTPPTKRVNLRIGAQYEDTKVEFFVENVFDNRAYRSSSPAFDTNDGNRPVPSGTLPQPRRIGVRIHTVY